MFFVGSRSTSTIPTLLAKQNSGELNPSPRECDTLGAYASLGDDARRQTRGSPRGFWPEIRAPRWQDSCGNEIIMTITKIFMPVSFVAAFALAPVSANAQHRGGGGHGGGQSRGAAVSRGGANRGGAVRGGTVRGVPSRGFSQSRSYPVYRGGLGVRGGTTFRGASAFRGGFAVRGGVAPRIIGSRGAFIGRSAFYRPYYSFRPRLSLGFGLWAGYPVAYPYYYDYPYGYAYPYPYGSYPYDDYGYAAPSYSYPAQPYTYPNQATPYPPSNYPSSAVPDYDSGSSAPGYPAQQPPSVGVERGGAQAAPGGVSFEITPGTAAVFVDGTFVGTAATFGPSSQPLGLVPGRHHIEIRASGYRTMTFDADITSGQVIPYQGTLQRD
jgi:hypothetical protein